MLPHEADREIGDDHPHYGSALRKAVTANPALPHFPLMRLPGELRNLIYHSALISKPHTNLVRECDGQIGETSGGHQAEKMCGPSTCLLSVSRQVNAEATPIFYRINTFAVSTASIQHDLPVKVRNFIRLLEVDPSLKGTEYLKTANRDEHELMATRFRIFESAIPFIISLVELRRLTVNVEHCYSTGSQERCVAALSIAVAEWLVGPLNSRREAGLGNVNLEFAKLSFRDLQLLHGILYPKSYMKGISVHAMSGMITD